VAGATSLLLEPLRRLYPGGERWLASRLDDVLAGHAAAFCAVLHGVVVGVTIVTPKRHSQMKLSTVFVADDAREMGVGSALVDAAVRYADAEAVSEMWVTVAHHVASQLSGVLTRSGFIETAFVRNRYGDGRHEVVYTRLA
jgi:GNAT superfamily N-acetyltransferase